MHKFKHTQPPPTSSFCIISQLVFARFPKIQQSILQRMSSNHTTHGKVQVLQVTELHQQQESFECFQGFLIVVVLEGIRQCQRAHFSAAIQ
ncbi:hypothetical protein JTE90_025895 [Oedothorax gibbosus]|uniref:Uncharacterized protein n=1 Tax=Oedothorax gibbosus TaxID=931172 RepID=A0AAV6TKG1_9ARAC|nr:hypothetical protein JTE90_025895 [Oedothorax gibbosus]